MGTDFSIESDASPDEVGHVVASVIGVRRDEVVVIGADDEWPSKHVHTVCRVIGNNQGFRTTVMVDSATNLSEHDFVSGIAWQLASRCLMSTDSVNPYEWLCVTPDGVTQTVFVDVDALDRDQLVLTDRGQA